MIINSLSPTSLLWTLPAVTQISDKEDRQSLYQFLKRVLDIGGRVREIHSQEGEWGIGVQYPQSEIELNRWLTTKGWKTLLLKRDDECPVLSTMETWLWHRKRGDSTKPHQINDGYAGFRAECGFTYQFPLHCLETTFRPVLQGWEVSTLWARYPLPTKKVQHYLQTSSRRRELFHSDKPCPFDIARLPFSIR